MLFYLSAILIVVATSLLVFYKRSYGYWKSRGAPYIEPESIYGSLKDSITLKIHVGKVTQRCYNYARSKNWQYVGAYFFFKPSLIPVRPELIKLIMMKDFSHFTGRGLYFNEEDDPLSAHLFAIGGLKWKNLRAKLTPTFTSGKLKNMFQILVDCSEDLKSCLDESKNEAIDIKKVLGWYTMNVIGSCAFGIECNSFKNPGNDFVKHSLKIFNMTTWDKMKIFLGFIVPKIAEILHLRVTDKDVEKFFMGILKETIEYREKNDVTRKDFLQLLIQLKNKGSLDDSQKSEIEEGTTLTFNEAAAQAFLFFLAGFETSSTTMSFALYELSKNQEIQDKVRQEINTVLKKYDGKITYDSLMDMRYLEGVIQETLRLHPPLQILHRICTHDYKVPDTNLTIEKGVNIIIPVRGLHMDPEYFPNPEKFDPDRFSEENKSSIPDFAYLPFGEGPRICIGLRFGMMQSKVGLVRLLSSYKFTVNPKTSEPIVYDPTPFICTVKGGLWLNAE